MAEQSNCQRDLALELRDCSFYYGAARAVAKVSLPIYKNRITALIGPSGCGKSTVLRGINRMLELTPGARVEGQIIYRGKNLYAEDVDPVEVRRRIGMVFQKPNPFPKSIFDNVAYGPRLLGVRKKSTLEEIVERSLRGASLWDEVSGDLNKSGMALSGGQQQRLCIARTIAVEPDIILMDEPCSALDPIATQRIEELMSELQRDYTIVIVTHNMQQAQRASDTTAFFNIRKQSEIGHEVRWGELVEYNMTRQVFENPALPETADYIAGRFG
ncbi:MAG: phosphate ABC transporter ATP-binding protein PstB [Chloroflexi bacterium]|nr:phosphate ABC transporter ATP-binding protein PstB [Chloroflexota bacterium]